MKILNVVTGIGYGDSVREHAILNEFIKKDKKTEVLVLAYDNSYEYFKKRFKTINMRGFKFTGYNLKFQLSSFFLLNFILPFYWIYKYLNLRKEIKAFNPDFILSDFEPFGLIISRFLKKKCYLVFAFDFDDYNKYSLSNKLTFKQRLEAFYVKLLYKNGHTRLVFIPRLTSKKESHGKYISVNPIIRSTPKDLQDKKKLMKKLNLKREPILLMMGGSQFGLTLANKIIRFVKDYDEDFIIFGYSTKFSRDNLKACEFEENFLEYLKVSEAVITLAGNKTLSEVLIFKKPSLVFPIADHIEQILNVELVKNYVMVGDYKNIKESMTKFLSDIPRIQRKVNKIRVNSSGAKEIVAAILRDNKLSH